MSFNDNTIFYIYQQRDVNHFRIALYGQGSSNTIWMQVYRWLISYMTPLSEGTPRAYPHTLYIFLASRIIGLHFATNDIGLSSFIFFWCDP